MSRLYEMEVNINGYDRNKFSDIIAVWQEEWDYGGEDDAEDTNDDSIWLRATGQLGGGEDESEFARRLTNAIWKANGTYCDVIVTARCLEYIPSENYQFHREDYDKICAKRRSEKN